MKKYNVFIVAGPLHVMNAIEAISYFNTKNNILLILYTANSDQLNQMEKLLGFAKWHSVKYIPLPEKKLDKIFFVQKVYMSLKGIEKKSLEKVFVGEYRSDHVNHIVNFFQSKEVYLLDDGLAQLSYHEEIATQSLKVRVRRLIYMALLYKLKRINYTFFSMFEIENEKCIKNNYLFFKQYIEKKETEDIVYFIGQPLVELNIISELDYREMIAKVMEFYVTKRFVYIMHRREKEKNIEKLSEALNFKYLKLSNLIELEMINAKVVPSDFSTFFSTAIVTLPKFIENSEYRVFELENRYLNKEYISEVTQTYSELKKMDLQVERL